MVSSTSALAIGLSGGVHGPVHALGRTDAHERGTGVLHDRAKVGEVEVDEARDRDDLEDALDALAQDAIDDLERVDERFRLGDDVADAVVGDRDERVDRVAELDHGRVGDRRSPAALRS